MFEGLLGSFETLGHLILALFCGLVVVEGEAAIRGGVPFDGAVDRPYLPLLLEGDRVRHSSLKYLISIPS